MVKISEYPPLFIKERYEVIKKLPTTDREKRIAQAIRRALKNKEWKQIVPFLMHPRLALLLAQTGEEGKSVKIVFVSSKKFLFSFPKILNEIGKGGYKTLKDSLKGQQIEEIL